MSYTQPMTVEAPSPRDELDLAAGGWSRERTAFENDRHPLGRLDAK